jgi:FRG domain
MIQQFSISSLSELVRYIEDQCSEQSTVFFRGQRTDEPLRPSIARLNPKRYSLLEAEKKILRAFQRRSLPFLEMRPETTWDWLAVAQHYGAPTRLLDWSVSALSAVWFAVERPAVRDERENGGLRAGVIWIFHARDKVIDQGGDYISATQESDPFKMSRPGILVPRYVSRRIVAQGGYFTVHRSWNEEPHFRPLEEDENIRERLVKVVVPGKVFPCIRHDLTRLGVNAMSIYQDLEALCQDIKWRYAYLADDEMPTLWGENGQLVRQRENAIPWLPHERQGSLADDKANPALR